MNPGYDGNILLGANISPEKSILKMMFLFFKVGYVSSLEGSVSLQQIHSCQIYIYIYM